MSRLERFHCTHAHTHTHTQCNSIQQRAGRECGENAEYFLRSVKEAETFLAAKCNKGQDKIT